MQNETRLIHEQTPGARRPGSKPDPGGMSECIWILKRKLRNTVRELESYKNDNKYEELRREYESLLHQKDVEIDRLKKELQEAHDETRKVRRLWNEVIDDAESENRRRNKQLAEKLEAAEKRLLRAEGENSALKQKIKELNKKYYEAGGQLEEEKEKNKKLTAQVNKDFQNSSIPSSQQGAGRKKIPNSRTKSGLKPGGQKGHEGHRLQQQKPTETHHIQDPKEYADDPDYYATGGLARRQKIFLDVGVRVVEYTATIFRNRKTGSKVHAEFPPGYDTDISYDGSVKSAAFLMNSECNVSSGKTRKFLREISGGRIDMSEATISGLVDEFACKADAERKEAAESIMSSPVVNVDFTNANVNGEAKQVLIMASPFSDAAAYLARDNKGHKGVQGTILEGYVGTLIHDHDKTFYAYGLGHQECMQHNLRYLTGSEQNEPGLTWNVKMHDLLGRMLHYRKTLGEAQPDPEHVAALEKEYDEILEIARDEYEAEPPGDGYREGYNLYIRLGEYKESELLFLHDKNVPPDNSLAERCARKFKRKQKQAMVFRSMHGLANFCNALGFIQSMRSPEDENAFIKVIEIFRRPKPLKNFQKS